MSTTKISLLRAPIISQLASRFPTLCSVDLVDRDESLLRDDTIVNFTKPTDILVSRWYPGYRVTSLRGQTSEETIAILLAATLDTADSLASFRLLLTSPQVPARIIGELFPRAAVPITAKKVLVTETYVREVVRKAVGTQVAGTVVDAYANAIIQVLAHPSLDFVQLSPEQKVLAMSDTYVASVASIRRALLIDAMRGIFSDARANDTVRSLRDNTTPQVLAETIARSFRAAAHLIPEIQLRLEQLDVAVSLVGTYVREPALLGPQLQAHAPLGELASIANFLVAAVYDQPIAASEFEGAFFASVPEQKDACTRILEIIRTAPSLELISLSSFAEMTGEVPVITSDGTRRGLVLYGSAGQETKMEVLDVAENGATLAISALPGEYAKATSLAPVINSSLLAVGNITQLANVIADEVTREVWAPESAPSAPVVATFNMHGADLIYVALHRANTVAISRSASGVVRLAYACTPASQWRSGVHAATPDTAFFTSPAATILYTSSGESIEPRSLPSRQQHLGALVARDTEYLGNIEPLLSKAIQREFSVTVEVKRGLAEPLSLQLDIGVLSHLLGFSAKTGAPARGDAYYATIAEPGVDTELCFLFEVARLYTDSEDGLLADRAKSWLVEHLAPLVVHPVTASIAQRALNEAVMTAGVDLRRMAGAHRDLVIAAMFGTALAILSRFSKIDPRLVQPLMKAVPLNGLSLKAQMALLELPRSLNV